MIKMKYISSFSWVCLLFALVGTVRAERVPGLEKKAASGFRTADACVPPSASAQLDINNVKCMLYNGGDMWWDLVGNPRYEIPKGSGRHSLFAASLWIGGVDASGQMRVAAQTYRQDGYDFWGGPLTQGSAEVNSDICSKYNKMHKITKAEIDAFRADYELDGIVDNPGDYPNVLAWPAFGTDADGNTVSADFNGNTIYLAPFKDVDGNSLDYNPSGGDYPLIKGDQAVWWVINDKGNIHTATSGEPIGVEMHIMAFAFTTANAINNMTFYDQLIINRSSLTLNQTYMGQWVDADLGYYKDDYVGCDTLRGLGITYNADNSDDGANGYGLNPPAVGIDFFQGPLADPGDGVDNDKDGQVDEQGETIIMSKFVYYNNDFSLKGNPETAIHYYNYLRGIWKDGTPMVANNRDGYGPTAAGPTTNYMFSGDICAGTGWTEKNANNAPDDRRLLESAGPFTLQPGAVNQVITGVVWARGSNNLNSVCQLVIADDVAQALFDNGFRLLDGPEAPVVNVGEYDKEIVLSWGYDADPLSNNFNESYLQADPVLKAQGNPDSLFAFQGYMVYQLADATVGLNDLTDPAKAKLVAQCDVKDGIGLIKNRTEQIVNDGNTQDTIIVDKVMVEGANQGLFRSIKIKEDKFSFSDDNRLVNYTPYYFAVIAYAYNNVTSDGRQFVPGNGKFGRAKVRVLPHPIAPEQGGMVLQSAFGDGVPVSQIGGYGNGGKFTLLSEATENAILSASNGNVNTLTFKAGASPISVKVVNPKDVKGGDYRLVIERDSLSTETLYVNPDTTTGAVDSIRSTTYSDWVLYNKTNNQWTEIFRSTYKALNNGTVPRPLPLQGGERVIEGYGFSIDLGDVAQGGDTVSSNAGVIGSSITFDDPSKAWLAGLPDDDSKSDAPWNWILAGQRTDQSGSENRVNKGANIYDKFQNFEKILGGVWGPFCFAREFNNNENLAPFVRPGIPYSQSRSFLFMGADEFIGLNELTDIDIVYTSDKSKWTRCVVVETSPTYKLGSGAWTLSAKYQKSKNKDGQEEGGTLPTNYGMSWFPGYAINVNTGQRLCILFGESTWDHQNRGDDMLFNPSSSFGSNGDRVGGRHYVYVTDLPYTGETGGGIDTMKQYLMNGTQIGMPISGSATDPLNPPADGAIALRPSVAGGNPVYLADFYRHVSWASVAMCAPGYDLADPAQIPSTARVSIRLNQKFATRQFNNSVLASSPTTSTSTPDEITFEFSTESQKVKVNELAVADSALDMIRVVPNPYYAYSAYENGQLENQVKITNLPQQCTINIFTINGQLIRTFNKNSDEVEQLWDLKNQSAVPVASGAYLIHINAPGIGERVVKCMVIMRQLDLNSY